LNRKIILLAIILFIVILSIPFLLTTLQHYQEIPFKHPPMIKSEYSSRFLTVNQGSTFEINITETSLLDSKLTLLYGKFEIMAYNDSTAPSPPQEQTLNYTLSRNPIIIPPKGTNSTTLTVTMANDAPVGRYLLYLRYENSTLTYVGGNSFIVTINPTDK
jgi:hypothetical protein